jgi:predicted dehydrogenase
MWQAAEEAGVKHLCGFNYRFVPAVRLARDVIQRGLLGRIYHFRARYLQESAHMPEAPWPLGMGTAGALLILGCHILDIGRFLVDEVASVQAQQITFNQQRQHPTETGHTVEIVADEAVQALLTFAGGSIGSIEAAFTCTGRKNQQVWEVNGDRGSLWFDLEDLNRLHVHLDGGSEDDLADVAGFRDVLVTERHHPYYQVWWPHGHILGWEHAHINQAAHFLRAVATGSPVAPDGATFEDGYRAAAICDAIVESAHSGQRVTVTY